MSDAEEYQCSKCQRFFSTPVGLSNHARTHPKMYSYRCWYCKNGFKNKYSLQRHIRRQHGKSSRSSALTSPGSGSGAEDPFEAAPSSSVDPEPDPSESYEIERADDRSAVATCTECSSVFHDQDLFLDHKQTHIEQQVYECPKCERYYLGLVEYLEHENQH